MSILDHFLGAFLSSCPREDSLSKERKIYLLKTLRCQKKVVCLQFPAGKLH